ncbi:MAG: GIY-YIG nuclease family protein [Ignavibacteriales bacterium]|nr:GIY-YIG nuclease family protein [Ignavibacteriales bacterium]
MYFTYILQSLKDKTYYFGSTQNLEQRLKEHNAGRVRFTKGHLPYQIIYSETYHTRKEAVAREKFFKSIDGYRWLKENKIT